MVGKLIYIMIGTRPDLVFSISTLAKYSSGPTPAHLAACKRVIRYLHGTSSHGIQYSGDRSACIGFTDSDYAEDRNNRKSTSGYVFTAYEGAISCKSCQQTSVALSSTEDQSHHSWTKHIDVRYHPIRT